MEKATTLGCSPRTPERLRSGDTRVSRGGMWSVEGRPLPQLERAGSRPQPTAASSEEAGSVDYAMREQRGTAGCGVRHRPHSWHSRASARGAQRPSRRARPQGQVSSGRRQERCLGKPTRQFIQASPPTALQPPPRPDLYPVSESPGPWGKSLTQNPEAGRWERGKRELTQRK